MPNGKRRFWLCRRSRALFVAELSHTNYRWLMAAFTASAIAFVATECKLCPPFDDGIRREPADFFW